MSSLAGLAALAQTVGCNLIYPVLIRKSQARSSASSQLLHCFLSGPPCPCPCPCPSFMPLPFLHALALPFLHALALALPPCPCPSSMPLPFLHALALALPPCPCIVTMMLPQSNISIVAEFNLSSAAFVHVINLCLTSRLNFLLICGCCVYISLRSLWYKSCLHTMCINRTFDVLVQLQRVWVNNPSCLRLSYCNHPNNHITCQHIHALPLSCPNKSCVCLLGDIWSPVPVC